MDIEKLATSAIEDAISKTDYITPYINSGDREPCWDGYLYAYSNPSRKNEFFSGKVPVQVKGQKCSKFSEKEHKYLVRVSDLKNFCIEGGTIYFVVQINSNGDKKIFYNALLPFELNTMLMKTEKKNKITIKMYEFPKDKNEITNIILNFVQDKKSQVLLRNGKNISLGEAIRQIGMDKFSFSFSYIGLGYDRNEPYKYLLNHGVYLYAECKCLNLKIPIDHVWRAEECTAEMSGEIRVGNAIFYNEYVLVNKADKDEIHIGKSVVLVFNHDGTAKMQYKLSGNLNERIVAEEMICSLIREKAVFINSECVEINPLLGELETFDKENMENHLEYLKTIKEVLDSMGVNEPLDCEKITEKDEGYIKMLIMSQRYNQRIEFNNIYIPPMAYIQIGNLKLLLHFKQQDDGKYIIKNHSNCKIDMEGEYTDGTRFPTSKYTILRAEDFATISNLEPKIVVNELVCIRNKGHIERVIITLIEMIKAYDMSHKQSLLEEAIQLAEWISQIDETDISRINLLQCNYRKKGLTEDEENVLEDMAVRNREDKHICAAIYILLRKFKKAKSIIDTFSIQQKATFKEYPIYSLLKD